MVRRFDENSTRPSRALQIWLILISQAYNRQTLTYGMLAEMLGFRGAGTLGQFLYHIMYYCQENDLPALTVLVVNHGSGLPSEAADLDVNNLNSAREAVFNYDWFSIYPPTPEELRKAYASMAG